MSGKYSYKLNDTTTEKGCFNVYQARNGSIQLVMGNNYITLCQEQVESLSINLCQLDNFNNDSYNEFYKTNLIK